MNRCMSFCFIKMKGNKKKNVEKTKHKNRILKQTLTKFLDAQNYNETVLEWFLFYL